MRRTLTALLLALALAGCASSGTAGGGGDPSHISTEDLRALDPEGLTAMQVVQRFRPQWLRTRGTATFGGGTASGEPRIVLDGVPLGEMGELRRVDATDVEEMTYLSASDATTRFGTGYPGGAILVVTRRGER